VRDKGFKILPVQGAILLLSPLTYKEASRRGKVRKNFRLHEVSFTVLLKSSGHGSVRDYLGYGSIYHLFSRTLHSQIEKGNLRKHSFEYIRTRLVLRDFILANPEVEYLETEQDKVTFFCGKLGVAKEFRPSPRNGDHVLPACIHRCNQP
jgi:hypothetical protein